MERSGGSFCGFSPKTSASTRLIGRDENAPAASSLTNRRRRGSSGLRRRYTKPPFRYGEFRELFRFKLFPCTSVPTARGRWKRSFFRWRLTAAARLTDTSRAPLNFLPLGEQV